MYQAAAGAKWVKAGAVSHAICLHAHNEELQRQFFLYGFGLRCLDAIRPMELIDCEPCENYDFIELSKAEFYYVLSASFSTIPALLRKPFLYES